MQKSGVHILKSLEVLKRWKVSTISSSKGIVESRDKSFVRSETSLYYSGLFFERFPPIFFTVKLICFIGFPRLSYLVLFIFLLCMILT